ncbi:MAG: OmpA family protein, partial [Myxococcales bacterium]
MGSLALSRRRAEVVARWLIDRGRVNPARIRTSGRGLAVPIADPDTEEGRVKNRRVEI